MKYNDSLISSPEDFARMAKEYSAKLKQEKRLANLDCPPALIDGICYSITFLNWLYSYIKRNLRISKLQLHFENMEQQTRLDIDDLLNFFNVEKNIKLTKPRRLNNFHSCIKLAINCEAEFLQKILLLNNTENEFVLQIANNHLDFIKKLSAL